MKSFRVASDGLAGMLLLLGLALPVRAGNFFSSCKPDCGGECTTEVVKIPGHQVIVETARPQVVVNETRVARPKRIVTTVAPFQAIAPMAPLAPAPMVATIYTPMAFPMAAAAPQLSAVAPSLSAPPACQERKALNAAHDMETYQLELLKLHAAQQVELAHTQKVFERVSATMSSGLSFGTPKLSANGTDPTNIQTQLRNEVQRLENAINGGNDYSKRLEGLIKEVQQLVVIHDEVIKKKVLQANNGGSGCGSCDTTRLEGMITELQKLTLKHDDILRELVRQRAIPLPAAPPMSPAPKN